MVLPHVPSPPIISDRREVKTGAASSRIAARYTPSEDSSSNTDYRSETRVSSQKPWSQSQPGSPMTSNHRQPYVREATEGGTERSVIPSPGPSQERRHIPEDVSEASEQESRHVSFGGREIHHLHEEDWSNSADDQSTDISAGRTEWVSKGYNSKY